MNLRSASSWKNETFTVQGKDIAEASVTWDPIGHETIELTVVGESARKILIGRGDEPVPEDVELMLARQDAIEANSRAIAAETRIRNLMDEIEDYAGELEALRAELVEARKSKAKSLLPGSAFYHENWHVTFNPPHAETSALAGRILKDYYEDRIHG